MSAAKTHADTVAATTLSLLGVSPEQTAAEALTLIIGQALGPQGIKSGGD